MKKIKARKKYNMGSGGGGATEGTEESGQGLAAMAGMFPDLADGIIGLLEGGAKGYSKEPLVNPSTMRNMVSPYSFAFGGSIDDLDEEQLAQLQAMADEQGVSVEEIIEMLQNQEEGGEEDIIEEDIPEEFEEEDTEDEEGEEAFAMGGFAGKVPIEVEGDEVLETPDGTIKQAKGASHEQGGIDVNVPKGTKIFSDRLQVDGKSMQQRKIGREKIVGKIQKLMGDKPSDKLLKNTLERTLETTAAEEEQDMILQKIAGKIYAQPQARPKAAMGGVVKEGKYGYGTGPDDPYLDKTGMNYPGMGAAINDYLDEETLQSLNGKIAPVIAQKKLLSKTNTPSMRIYNSDEVDANVPPFAETPVVGATPKQETGVGARLTTGDKIGLAGNIFNAIAPIINTNRNRAATKPNINRWKSFGRDALTDNSTAQNYVAAIRSSELTDMDTSANSSFARNRSSAKGVNTVRALDIATDMGKNKARTATNNSFSKAMMSLMGTRGQLNNAKDSARMSAQERTDIADKQDVDNYYTNMAQNLTNLGTNVQGIGKAFNVRQKNNDDADLLGLLTKNGIKVKRNRKGNYEIVNTNTQ